MSDPSDPCMLLMQKYNKRRHSRNGKLCNPLLVEKLSENIASLLFISKKSSSNENVWSRYTPKYKEEAYVQGFCKLLNDQLKLKLNTLIAKGIEDQSNSK